MQWQNKEDYEMSGIRYFLDTNAIIALLKGNAELERLLARASWIGTLSIVIIEFLSFQGLTKEDLQTFRMFVERIHIKGLSTDLADLRVIANIRRDHSFKLPDAIIVAQSLQNEADLISNDKQLKEFTYFSF